MELLTFRRNKLYYFTVIILTLYLLLGWYHFLRGNHIKAGVMLQSTSYINMSATLLGLFSGIMTGRSDKMAHFQEVLSSLPGVNIRPAGKIYALCIVSIILTLLGYLDILILFKISGSEYLLFKKEILIYVIIYWGVPLFSCGMLGYFLETVIPSNRLLIPVTLLLWIAISPFNILFYSVLPEKALLLLNIGENDAQAYYDEYSGLYISGNFIKNAAIFLFLSLFLFIGGILYKKRDVIRKMQKYVMVFAMLLIAFTTYFLFNSINRVEYAGDDIYYLEASDNSPISKLENEELTMMSCDIEIYFKEDEICYTAQEYISSMYGRTVPFTLYHGLELISVKAGDEKIDFKREGDLLYLTLPEGMEQGLITFEVRGNTGDYYPVKENSVFLSSTFPWYPVPGEFIVTEKGFPYAQVEFKNVELKEPAEFYVEIKGTDQFFSTLEKISENEFYGFQKGVSLLKGMLILKNINGNEYLVPPDRIDSLISEMSEVEEKIKYISEIIEKPLKKIPDKIFVKPAYSSFHQYNYIFTEDHLTLGCRQYSSLSDIKGVFRAFYWNNIYREADNSHAYIFEIVLDYMEKPERDDNYINIFAEDDSSDYIFLQNLSSEIIGLHKLNPAYLKELLKDMYGKIENNPELPLNYWLEKIDEIKRKG